MTPIVRSLSVSVLLWMCSSFAGAQVDRETHFVSRVDVDGDGVHTGADEFVARWWLDHGGSFPTLDGNAVSRRGLFDLSRFWSTPAAQLPQATSSPAQAAAAVVAGCKFLRGDSNDSCGADLADCVFLLAYLFQGGQAPVNPDAADTNDSGAIDISDVTYLLAYLFSGGAPPPEPFPTSGYDPTADTLNTGCNLHGDVLAQPVGEPNPGQNFRVLLSAQLVDVTARPDWHFEFTLDAQLAAAYQSVSVADDLSSILFPAPSLAGNVLTVNVTDSGIDPYFDYGVLTPILQIHFSSLPADTYGFAISAVDALSGGTSLGLNLNLEAFDVSIAGPFVESTALPGAFTNVEYSHGLAARHFARPVTWSLVAGALPAGLSLNSSHGIIAGTLAPGSVGAFPFTIQAQGKDGATASQSFLLSVSNRLASIVLARYRDNNLDSVVSAGDSVTVYFDEPVIPQAKPKWSQTLLPAQSGDTFGVGAGATVNPNDPKVLVVTLGSGAQLSSLGQGGGVMTIASTGLRDQDGSGVAASAKALTEWPPEWNTRWVSGAAITPLVLTSPPFVDPGYTVEDLPAGLQYQNGAISGTPTTSSDGMLRVIDSNGSLIHKIYWRVGPAFGLRQLSPTTLHPGDFLQLEVTTEDLTTPIAASIGATTLLAAPGSSPASPFFILPDNTISGDLVVSQGLSQVNAGFTMVAPIANPGSPAPIISAFTVWGDMRKSCV